MIINYAHNKKGGFVSIFTVLVIMSVLTTVALGFSVIVRQAQVRVLDNQLSVQALYAAESAVNDAALVLASDPTYTKDSCKSTSDGFSYDLDIDRGISYSCLLIDPTPYSLTYDNVGSMDSPVLANLQSSDGQNINTVSISWDGSSGPTNSPLPDNSSASLSTTTSWANKLGLLRIDIIPLDALDRSSLSTQAITVLLYPTKNSSGVNTVVLQSGDQERGRIILVRCDDNAALSYRCETDLNLGGNRNRYAVRLSSYYNSVNVKLGIQNNGGQPLSFLNGQALVDATGKANNVLKRVQVALPLFDTSGYREAFALSSADSICKRLFVSGGIVDIDSSIFGSDITASTSQNSDSNSCTFSQ